MITSLSGTLSTVGLDWVEVTVGGVGLRVNVPSSLIEQVGQVGEGVKLFTSLQVKEDSLTLYGFPSSDGRQAFEALLGVNGVGPRVALSILSTLAPDELANAVATDDLDVFKGVTGVGNRTAQRITMELKGKLDVELTVASMSGPSSEWSQTLTAMGYGDSEIQAYKALVSQSEVGPKVALSILSSLTLEELAIAVEINDLDALDGIPGVGVKTAQRIISDLKGKLDVELPSILMSKREAEWLDTLTTMGYGDSETQLFVFLTGHSEVNPKVALSILSSLTLEELAIAVEINDLDTFDRVPGVGPKTAERIVTELKGKLDVELPTILMSKREAEWLDTLTTMGYGDSEVQVFRLLTDDSEVSPKVALSILSSLTLEELAVAVEVDDLDVFNRAPGVGAKTAQQIVSNLKGKLDIELSSPLPIKPEEELLDALTPLGYSASEVALAAASFPRDEPLELEDKIRLALEYLAGQ